MDNTINNEQISLDYYTQLNEDALLANLEDDIQELNYPELSVPALNNSEEKPTRKIK